MEWEELRNKIANDKRLFTACINEAGLNNYKDLYQEVMVKILDPKNEKVLLEAEEGGYLSIYIIGAIKDEWSKKDRVKTHSDGRTSNLYMFCDHQGDWKGYKEEMKYSTLSGIPREVMKKAVGELHRRMLSDNEKEREEAKTLWGVCKTNVLQYSKESGVNRIRIKKEAENAAKKIKRNL